MQTRKEYFNAAKFKALLTDFREKLKKDDSAKPCDQIGIMLMTLVKHTLGNQQFKNYNSYVKDELNSYCLTRCVKGLVLVDYERPAKDIFNYFTRTIFFSAYTALSKHYKQTNIKRELSRKYLLDKGVCYNDTVQLLGKEYK